MYREMTKTGANGQHYRELSPALCLNLGHPIFCILTVDFLSIFKLVYYQSWLHLLTIHLILSPVYLKENIDEHIFSTNISYSFEL